MDMSRRILATLLLMTLAGCVTNGDAVRCDGRLEPINMPDRRETQSGHQAGTVKANPKRFDRE